MSSKPQKSWPKAPSALSRSTLLAILIAKEREADRQIANEFASRRAQMAFQEGLAERMGRITDLDELCRMIVDELRLHLGVAQATLALVTEDQFLEVVAATQTLPPHYQMELLEEAFIVDDALAIGDDDADGLMVTGCSDLPRGVPLRAMPLHHKDGRPLGALVLEGPLCAGREAWLAPFLTGVSEALEDCQHYARIEGLIFDGLLAIAHALEAPSPRQCGRITRVEQVSVQIANALGLGETQTRRVRVMALVHGLSREQALAAFAAIRRGHQTASLWRDWMSDPFVAGIYPSPLATFQRIVDDLEFLYARWDGKENYPDFAGDRIPLTARIVAVAMAFENLTGTGDHRKSLTILQALAHLQKFAGAQFDPVVMAALGEHFLRHEMGASAGQ